MTDELTFPLPDFEAEPRRACHLDQGTCDVLTTDEAQPDLAKVTMLLGPPSLAV